MRKLLIKAASFAAIGVICVAYAHTSAENVKKEKHQRLATLRQRLRDAEAVVDNFAGPFGDKICHSVSSTFIATTKHQISQLEAELGIA